MKDGTQFASDLHPTGALPEHKPAVIWIGVDVHIHINIFFDIVVLLIPRPFAPLRPEDRIVPQSQLSDARQGTTRQAVRT